MSLLDPITDERVEVLSHHHEEDIDALKQIVIGLTARVNELEFTTRRRPGLFFRNHPSGH